MLIAPESTGKQPGAQQAESCFGVKALGAGLKNLRPTRETDPSTGISEMDRLDVSELYRLRIIQIHVRMLSPSN